MASSLGCRREPGVSPGERVEVRVSFGAADGPRTPEGARLSGFATLDVAVRAGNQGRARADLDGRVRTALLSTLEERLREDGWEALAGGSPDTSPVSPLATDLAARLAASGLELLAVHGLRLEVPGDDARRALAPTTDLRVLMVGLDGLDWDVAQPLMDEGAMPRLARLVATGTRARLLTVQPILSPVIWTSVATGRAPAHHGIVDFLGTDAAGNAVPVTSNLRRVPAFWNVLGDAGVSVGVSAWWATWPAEPVRGFMVTDRVAYQLFAVDDTALPAVGKVHPHSLWSDVEPLVVRPRDVTAAEMEAFLGPRPRGAGPDAQEAQLLEHFAGVLAQTRTYAAIGLALHAREKPRVGAYYFESTDTASHLFMRYASPRLPEVSPAQHARFGPVVPRVYEYADRILGAFMDLADDRTVVIVLSDHGFKSGQGRPASESRVETATAADWHDRYGVLAMAGPGIRAGHELAEASVLDIFPTLLALLGMPLAADLDGRVLEEALTGELAAQGPRRRIPTFARGEANPNGRRFAEASPEDRAILEGLVAIGYVSPIAAAPSGPAAGRTGSEATRANAHNNMGTIHMNAGDLDAAVEELRQAKALSPSFYQARVNLAQALLRLGRAEEAERELGEVLASEPALGKALTLLSDLELGKGRPEQAEALARRALAADARSPMGHYTLGRALEARGLVEDARRALERAAELDPDNPEPFNALGNSWERAGDWARAATWYERSIARDPTYGAAHNNLGLQYQRLGRWEDALRVYEEGRRRLPTSSILLNNLATWHHQRALQAQAEARAAEARGDAPGGASARGRLSAEIQAAADLYTRAISANALDASPVNNLGALHEFLGRPDEQRRLYEEAIRINPRYADALHNLGDWLLQHQQPLAAHERFQRVLEIDPLYVRSQSRDAVALLQLGRGEEAVRQLRDALGRAPREPRLHAALGAVLEQLSRPGEACAAYRAALALDPRQADVEARLAVTCRLREGERPQ
jgi:tetratricopeptide (TPR) repeat protein